EATLGARQIDDCAAVEIVAVGWGAHERRMERIVAEVLEKNEPVLAGFAEDPGHTHAPAVEQIPDFQETPADRSGVTPKHLPRPGVRDEHRNGAPCRCGHADVPPRGRTAGHVR